MTAPTGTQSRYRQPQLEPSLVMPASTKTVKQFGAETNSLLAALPAARPASVELDMDEIVRDVDAALAHIQNLRSTQPYDAPSTRSLFTEAH